MKILVIGGTGTIGSAIVRELSSRHTIIVAARKGDVQVDISDPKSIEAMYQTVGQVDAVVSAAGTVHFASLSEMNADLYDIGLKNKLMGQVNLVLLGFPYLKERGSFTLTSGILSHDPILGGTAAAMVNGGIESFIKSAAIDMPKCLRINGVSPTILKETIGRSKYTNYFRGYEPVSAFCVALAYSKSVEGAQTGQIYRVGYTLP